jgi:hypothetical protein
MYVSCAFVITEMPSVHRLSICEGGMRQGTEKLGAIPGA